MNETQVRKLRAAIYGECTDNNWENCKDHWMRPDQIEWLKEHQP